MYDDDFEDFDFQKAVRSWSNPPFDNIGYFSSKEILKFKKETIVEFVKLFEENRYNTKGWRNHNNLWRSSLGLDKTKGKTIIDFGCGFVPPTLMKAA